MTSGAHEPQSRASTTPQLDAPAHRRLGVALFNRAWALMELPARTPEQNDELLHCAHASAYHWMHAVGTAANRARSEWQCSRVYSVLGHLAPALRHARRCLEIVDSAPEAMEPFDRPWAYEALARAHAVGKTVDESWRFLELARIEAAKIDDAEDRAVVENDLASIATALSAGSKS